jgi:hypothetical protein
VTAPGVADVRIRWVDGHSVGLGHWCGFGSLAVMGRSIAATGRGASADSSRRCRSPNLRTECHSGWTFKGPRALRPLRPGATANPEHWLCALFLWTLNEGSSSGGPPDFRACPKSIALKGSVNSTPRPAKAKEKHAGLSRPLGRPRVKRTIPAKQFVNEHRLIIIGTVPAAAHRPPSRPFGPSSERIVISWVIFQ